MSFAEAAALKAAWIIPLAIGLLWWAYSRRKRRLLSFFGEEGRGWVSGGRTILKASLWTLALLLLVVGLAGPRWDYEWQDIKRGGVDIMVVLDVSRSMLATDVDPNRLERAKREIVDLLGMAQGDRLGLVAFAGTAFVQCPLTADYGALRLFLDHLDTDLIPTQGTDIGFALQVAAEGLADGGPEEATGQAILLMTDGEDLEGDGLVVAKGLADKGIKIFTMSIGTAEGGPIPIPGGGYKKDQAGNLVMTKPDVNTLKQMAIAGGGSYISSVASDADLRYVYEKGIKAKLADREFETTRKRLWYERFQWFLLAAFLILVFEFLIADAKTRRAMASLIVAILMTHGLLPKAQAAEPGRSGQEKFEQQNYDQAADLFLEAEIEDPQSAQHAYNKGVADYRAGQFAEAAEAFERAAAKADGPLKEKSLFNLGNAKAMNGDLQDAVKAYEQTLELQPEHKQAEENMSYVKELIEQQPPPEQQGESDEKGEPTDEQNQSEDEGQNKDPGEQEEGQDQQSGEPEPQPSDGQEQSEGQQAEKNQSQENQAQGTEQDPGDEGEKKEEETAAAGEEDDSPPEGRDEKNPSGEDSAGDKELAGQDQRQSPDAMTPEEAERILRSVQSYSQRYLYKPPAPRAGGAPKKDW